MKHDPDKEEHEGATLKNSLHTIIRTASHLNKALSTQDNFPEWVSEKIGAIKSMMVTVMDYMISKQEMHRDGDLDETGGVIAGGIAAEGMFDNVSRGVDSAGRTQQEWLSAVKKRFPDGGPVTIKKTIQAKMIDGPVIVYLSDGRKLEWSKSQQDGVSGNLEEELSEGFRKWRKQDSKVVESSGYDDDDDDQSYSYAELRDQLDKWANPDPDFGEENTTRDFPRYVTAFKRMVIDYVNREIKHEGNESDIDMRYIMPRVLSKLKDWKHPVGALTLVRYLRERNHLKTSERMHYWVNRIIHKAQKEGFPINGVVYGPDGLTDDERKEELRKSYQNDKWLKDTGEFTIKEGKKVDRMEKHIEKSERKAGKSKKEAETIAWKTLNKRGMLNNKNKKKRSK